jgi:hypothetical protein
VPMRDPCHVSRSAGGRARYCRQCCPCPSDCARPCRTCVMSFADTCMTAKTVATFCRGCCPCGQCRARFPCPACHTMAQPDWAAGVFTWPCCAATTSTLSAP